MMGDAENRGGRRRGKKAAKCKCEEEVDDAVRDGVERKRGGGKPSHVRIPIPDRASLLSGEETQTCLAEVATLGGINREGAEGISKEGGGESEGENSIRVAMRYILIARRGALRGGGKGRINVMTKCRGDEVMRAGIMRDRGNVGDRNLVVTCETGQCFDNALYVRAKEDPNPTRREGGIGDQEGGRGSSSFDIYVGSGVIGVREVKINIARDPIITHGSTPNPDQTDTRVLS